MEPRLGIELSGGGKPGDPADKLPHKILQISRDDYYVSLDVIRNPETWGNVPLNDDILEWLKSRVKNCV